MSIQNYAMYLGQLLNREYSNEGEVKEALETIFCYINTKHEGRCISKKLFIVDEREKMIVKFCKQYFDGIDAIQMCQTKIMRKFAKHNSDNKAHENFIYPRIVNAQINKYFPQNEENINDSENRETPVERWIDPRLAAWLLDFDATILSPQALNAQKTMLSGMPDEYSQILTKGRTIIGNQLEEAAGKGWLTSEMLLRIGENLDKEKSFPIEPKFEQNSIEDYFLYRYLGLINSGDQYKNKFIGSLKIGMEFFSKDPRVTGKPFEKIN